MIVQNVFMNISACDIVGVIVLLDPEQETIVAIVNVVFYYIHISVNAAGCHRVWPASRKLVPVPLDGRQYLWQSWSVRTQSTVYTLTR